MENVNKNCSSEETIYSVAPSSNTVKSEPPDAQQEYDFPRSTSVTILHAEPKSPHNKVLSFGPPRKFPLLAKNYIINEATTPEIEEDSSSMNKRSPLEVLKFPEPPNEKPPSFDHYTVQKEGGGAEIYAHPSKILKPPKINASAGQNGTKPKVPSVIPEKILQANRTFDQKFAVLSPSSIVNMESMTCARCDNGFEPKAKIVNSDGELYHPECFVCAQCFRPFPDGVFYEFEGRKYCEHDFHVLFAPCCGKCGEFIVGRVIKAMMSSWHPNCFTCEMCHKELADLGFIKNQGRALCHECNDKVKATAEGKYMCQKCRSVIDGEPLRFRGEVYHPYHFNCTGCSKELTSSAIEVKTRPGYTANELNELYCLRCHFKMGIPICGACRRPIEERVVTALGKHWHVEHFVCAKCEKPFHGNRHYERKGLAYCETHYHQLFGNLCYVCNQVIQGDVFTALNKAWCVNHFACSSCDQKMTVKTKFYEVDLKPVCKKCYDRYPRELRLRLKKYHENEAARDQGNTQMVK